MKIRAEYKSGLKSKLINSNNVNNIETTTFKIIAKCMLRNVQDCILDILVLIELIFMFISIVISPWRFYFHK